MKSNEIDSEINASLDMLRVDDVLRKGRFSRSTFYSLIKEKLWTVPVKQTFSRISGWPRYEVNLLLAAAIAGKSRDEIKILVKDLEAKRKELGTTNFASYR